MNLHQHEKTMPLRSSILEIWFYISIIYHIDMVGTCLWNQIFPKYWTFGVTHQIGCMYACIYIIYNIYIYIKFKYF